MDDVEIEVTAKTDIVGSKSTTRVSFDREEWDEMSPMERDKAIFELAIPDLIEWNYEVVE